MMSALSCFSFFQRAMMSALPFLFLFHYHRHHRHISNRVMFPTRSRISAALASPLDLVIGTTIIIIPATGAHRTTFFNNWKDECITLICRSSSPLDPGKIV